MRRDTSTMAATRTAKAPPGTDASSSKQFAPYSPAKSWPTTIRSSATATTLPMSMKSTRAAAEPGIAAAACWNRPRSRANPPAACRAVPWERKPWAASVVSVEVRFDPDGILVRDQFLAPHEIRALIECARLRSERGDFAAARIGGERSVQRREEIRGDSTCWISTPLQPAEQSLLEKLECLRLELNRDCLLGLFELELHYAWYPPGAGYARHVDQPQGRAQRQVSLALYLNEEWSHEAGGALRIFDGGGHRDIEPIAGRLACFLTPGREHAVLPTQRDRLSISGWFRVRD